MKWTVLSVTALVVGLSSSLAAGAVLDRFACEITAYDLSGDAIFQNELDAYAQRTPYTPDEDDPWVPEVTATHGQIGMSIESPVEPWIRASFVIKYWHAVRRDDGQLTRAAQNTCMQSTLETDDQGEQDTSCFWLISPGNPRDPTRSWRPVPFDENDVPVFSTADMPSYAFDIEYHERWGRVAGSCLFLGTVY